MAAMNGACLAFESNELLSMHGHDTHLLDRENDSIESNDVRQIGSRELQALTGLSADQLREWAGRRRVVWMQKLLQGKSFPALWDHVILLRGRAIRLSEI